MFEFARKYCPDVAVDLGTATCLVHTREKGLVLHEPACLAVNNETDMVIKVGREAAELEGRTADDISVIHPMANGVISSPDYARQMLKYFVRRAYGQSLFPSRLIVGLPVGATEAEEELLYNAAQGVGARKVYLLDEPLAAAIGAGVVKGDDIFSSEGRMIVDIGGGTTDVAVICLGGIVVSGSIRVAGNQFNKAICRYMQQQYNLAVSDRMAEDCKIHIGAVYKHNTPREYSVKGRCLVRGTPRDVTVSSLEMLGAMKDPLTSILDLIFDVIGQIPSDMLDDVHRNGILLTGGSARLYGMDALISDLTEIPTRVATAYPERCVVTGLSEVMSWIENTKTEPGHLNLTRESVRIRHAREQALRKAAKKAAKGNK